LNFYRHGRQGNKTIIYKGVQGLSYLYKVLPCGEMQFNTYLGVAGPFSMSRQNYESSHEMTGIY
jgi:hypothetical protein